VCASGRDQSESGREGEICLIVVDAFIPAVDKLALVLSNLCTVAKCGVELDA
jgi:hypothetical protein